MKKILFATLLAFSSASIADYKITFSAFNVQLPKEIATSVSKIECGANHCYALVNGDVWSVGRNDHGQLGREGGTTIWKPTNLSNVSDLVAVVYIT
jgi:alpha-tubulin suppressor-like RCC1 family protein